MHALNYNTLLCKPYPKPSDIGHICMYTIKFAEVDEELEVPFTPAFNTNERWSSSYRDVIDGGPKKLVYPGWIEKKSAFDALSTEKGPKVAIRGLPGVYSLFLLHFKYLRLICNI